MIPLQRNYSDMIIDIAADSGSFSLIVAAGRKAGLSTDTNYVFVVCTDAKIATAIQIHGKR